MYGQREVHTVRWCRIFTNTCRPPSYIKWNPRLAWDGLKFYMKQWGPAGIGAVPTQHFRPDCEMTIYFYPRIIKICLNIIFWKPFSIFSMYFSKTILQEYKKTVQITFWTKRQTRVVEALVEFKIWATLLCKWCPHELYSYLQYCLQIYISLQHLFKFI
jgi:hypothetical protein